MAYLLHRRRLLLATFTAMMLAVTLNLASPAMTYAAGGTVDSSQRYPSEPTSRKCQCGW